jgi:RNA polymerase sigma factor (sigma-70 family)
VVRSPRTVVEYVTWMDAEELSSLVRAAADGDEHAWEALVDHFSGLIWSVVGAYGLAWADAADVTQVTWLRLVEHLGRLRDPTRVGAWLVTTTRRECLDRLRAANRESPAGDERSFEDLEFGGPSPESRILQSERESLVWRAFRQLGGRCQELIRVLILAQPALSYQEVADALEMPIGSIGPTRARCLDELRRRLGSGVSTGF